MRSVLGDKAQKIRINELARELEVKAGAIIEILPRVGIEQKKTHSSSVDATAAEAIRDLLQAKGDPPPTPKFSPYGQFPAERHLAGKSHGFAEVGDYGCPAPQPDHFAAFASDRRQWHAAASPCTGVSPAAEASHEPDSRCVYSARYAQWATFTCCFCSQGRSRRGRDAGYVSRRIGAARDQRSQADQSLRHRASYSSHGGQTHPIRSERPGQRAKSSIKNRDFPGGTPSAPVSTRSPRSGCRRRAARPNVAGKPRGSSRWDCQSANAGDDTRHPDFDGPSQTDGSPRQTDLPETSFSAGPRFAYASVFRPTPAPSPDVPPHWPPWLLSPGIATSGPRSAPGSQTDRSQTCS